MIITKQSKKTQKNPCERLTLYSISEIITM